MHHLEDGRRVYTIDEAATLTAGSDPVAVRRARSAIRQRLHRANAEAAGWINPRLPVYLPEQLGLPAGARTDLNKTQEKP